MEIAQTPPIDQLSYEQAFTELEKVVASLESGDHSLEQALQYYERGQALAKRCAELLDQAELKIAQLSEEQLSDFTTPD